MSFNKIPLIGNEHSDETRNIINLMVQVINNRGIEILSESGFLTWLDENGVKHQGEWDESKEYDRLSVVLYEGNSYTSVKSVPVGIDILNEEFWVVTGNYDAQIEYYRQDVRNLDKKLTGEMSDLDDKIGRTDIQVEYFGTVGNGTTDDTKAINDAFNFGHENGVRVSANKDYLISENINGFMGNDKVIKNIIVGDGSITRNGQTFYFRPKGNQTNVIFIGDNTSSLNDGLTKDKPVSLPVALEYISSLGEIVSDGHWVLRFIGEYKGLGFRNFKLPYFKNPLVFEGERDDEGNITSIINGVNDYDAYFFRADTDSTFAKFFEIRDLKFINFNRHASSAGAMVFWDNVDVNIHDCESYDCTRFAWVRNGRLRVNNNIMDNGHSGVTAQYHTSLNIGNNTIKNFSAYGVHLGRSSAGHVSDNTFNGNRINVEATQSSRLRLINNIHNDWELTGVNVVLNATVEGLTDEIINYNFPVSSPFYNVFYGSSAPTFQQYTAMERHTYSFPSQFFTIESPGEYNLNNEGFDSPLRANRMMLRSDTTHVKISLVVQSSLNPESEKNKTEFDIVLSTKENIEEGFVTIPIRTDSNMNGEIEIDMYSRKGSPTKYFVTKYPDGDKVIKKYSGVTLTSEFTTSNTSFVTRTFINHIKGSFNILGIISEISQ